MRMHGDTRKIPEPTIKGSRHWKKRPPGSPAVDVGVLVGVQGQHSVGGGSPEWGRCPRSRVQPNHRVARSKRGAPRRR